MTGALATFLVAVSTSVDAVDQPQMAPQQPPTPGQRPGVSDRAGRTRALGAPWLRRSTRDRRP
jgi:hypothetical protein